MTGRRPWTAMGAVAVVGALGLMTAGCGGDSPTSSTPTSAVVTSSTRVAATTVAPAPSSTAATSPPTTSPALPTVVDDVLRGGSEADRYTYEQTFPRLQGLVDLSVQDAINAQILTEVTAIVDDFVAGTDGYPDPSGPSADQRSALKGSYEVSRIDDALLSTRVHASPYFAGAAHPGSVQVTFNFDLRTGKRLALADLFTADVPYLATLSAHSRLLLATQPGIGGLPEFVTPGTEPTADNFAHWTLSDQDLVITFDQYQVAPGAAGTPHVSIPFASLRTILDPTGPLAIHN